MVKRMFTKMFHKRKVNVKFDVEINFLFTSGNVFPCVLILLLISTGPSAVIIVMLSVVSCNESVR